MNASTLSATVARYHRTLSAARALRAAYLSALSERQTAERVEAARRHHAEAWACYLTLCRRHGILAAHS